MNRGAAEDHRAARTDWRRSRRAGAGARDAEQPGRPARHHRSAAARARGQAVGTTQSRSAQPIAGDDPRRWADRRRQLLAQKPALAKAGVPDATVFRSGRHPGLRRAGFCRLARHHAARALYGRATAAGPDQPGRGRRVAPALGARRHRRHPAGQTRPCLAPRFREGRLWLLQLLARKPKKLAAVALANKIARIIRAMLVTGGPCW